MIRCGRAADAANDRFVNEWPLVVGDGHGERFGAAAMLTRCWLAVCCAESVLAVQTWEPRFREERGLGST